MALFCLQAEHDAQTLMESEQIKKDSVRLKRAKVQAKKMLVEETKKLNALKNISAPKKKGKPKGKKTGKK